MSSFDTVILMCPKCKRDIHVPTEITDGEHHIYHVHSIPLKILAELEGDVFTCGNCQTKFHLSIQKLVGVQPIIGD